MDFLRTCEKPCEGGLWDAWCEIPLGDRIFGIALCMGIMAAIRISCWILYYTCYLG